MKGNLVVFHSFSVTIIPKATFCFLPIKWPLDITLYHRLFQPPPWNLNSYVKNKILLEILQKVNFTNNVNYFAFLRLILILVTLFANTRINRDKLNAEVMDTVTAASVLAVYRYGSTHINLILLFIIAWISDYFLSDYYLCQIGMVRHSCLQEFYTYKGKDRTHHAHTLNSIFLFLLFNLYPWSPLFPNSRIVVFPHTDWSLSLWCILSQLNFWIF